VFFSFIEVNNKVCKKKKYEKIRDEKIDLFYSFFSGGF